ncbi:MAG TPA: SDR family NAD(P)-dependent oxidoreductase, partial [Mycobacteriales bacterium]|nr:SDR family NAD(P)-dependent oxidoreductase [Mycobacteriales bacterium]
RAEPVDLAGRTVLVTGATPGSLGFATAHALRAWGAQVVVSTRTRTSVAAAVLGPDVLAYPLDLADALSVEAFVRWYEQEVGRLDVLVNNAGIHLDLRSRWKQPRLTADGFELHWRTNYLGAAHLTHALLPLLLKADAPRVVNVVSKLHARGSNDALDAPLDPYDSWGAYGTSKLALVHLTTELARRHPSVGTAALHPGSVYTRIADRGLEEQRLLSRVRRVLAPLERRALLTPEQGAQTSLHCATAALPVSGGYYEQCAVREPSADARDSAAAARLWEQTASWLATLRPQAR